MGGGFNRPCHLLGRGGQALGTVQGRQGAVLSAHTAPSVAPLHTPGVTVDLDDSARACRQPQAVHKGSPPHAASGLLSTAAPQGRHSSTRSECRTVDRRVSSAVPLAWLRMPPTRAPWQHSHALQADSTQSTSRVCGSFERTLAPASAEALLQSRNTTGATHPAETATPGGPSRPAAALPGHGEHGAPRAEVQGSAPVLCSVAPRQPSLPLTHELRDEGVGAVWATAPLPPPSTLPIRALL